MASFTWKAGSMNYSAEEMQIISVFVKRLAFILNKLNDKEARLLAFAIDPTLDRYVLGGWEKQEIIQEALEDLVRDKFSPYNLANDPDLFDDLADVADIIQNGLL